MTDLKKVKVAPSLLAADPGSLLEEALKVQEAGADLLHLDVMDGRFVPAITFGASLVARLKRECRVPLDVHLMVEDPGPHVEAFASAGADIITIHVEAEPHAHRVLSRIKELGPKAGISLNPGTPVSSLRWVLDIVDLVLVMTVNPGAGGQAFIPSMLRKIENLRRRKEEDGLDLDIEVDGGITPETAPMVRQAGAGILVAGSAVFGSNDLGQAIRELKG